jgi:hypothetical protein
MMVDKKNPIWQGLAGGMVLATANGLSDKLLTGGDKAAKSGGEMADAQLEPGDFIVKADGMLYDQQGNPIARISENGLESAAPAQPALTAAGDTEIWDYYDHSLGESVPGSYEEGEAW